ncbi:MAG: leucine-rich repeat domain-containing protein, partial [Ruminiclostridium sp.]|nr:leucine-rich repeat domain-containing protein [Ruminiclostridium sp.]
PKSLREIGSNAFAECDCLEKVEFLGDDVIFELGVFDRCSELRAENILQSLACSLDITKPFVKEEDYEPGVDFDWGQALREDVFELALKYDSFAFFDKEDILRKIAEYDLCELLPLAENAGWSISEKLVSELLNISAENECVETTAWLLDYKNRKF